MDQQKRTIAIDMDGVIADTVAQFIKWHERDTGVRVSRKIFERKIEKEVLPDGAVPRYVRSPGFFRTAPLVLDAREALIELSKNFEIYIVSAAMEFPLSLSEKQEWLAEHFEFISWRNIVFCGDKSIIGTDFMIDDHVKNLDYFRGTSILFTSEHNLDIDRHIRVNNWQEALALFASM